MKIYNYKSGIALLLFSVLVINHLDAQKIQVDTATIKVEKATQFPMSGFGGQTNIAYGKPVLFLQ
jgi:hypothetical protein